MVNVVTPELVDPPPSNARRGKASPSEPEPDPAVDVGTILAAPDRVTLESGTEVLVQELRLDQFLAGVDILTAGAGNALMSIRLDPDEDDPDAFITKLVMMLALAVPKARKETAEFLRTMVTPVGLVPKRQATKADKARNDAAREALNEELENPDLDDALTIIEAMVLREAPHLQALGKRLASMWARLQKVGLIPASLTSTGKTS